MPSTPAGNAKALATSDNEMARRALARIPLFSQDDIDLARITRLRGLTNRVFRVEIARASYSLRVPGIGTDAIIDRRAEKANAKIAARAGLTPEILHFGADGLMLTRFVEAAEPLSAAGFRTRDGAVERAASTLRRLHDLAEPFVRDFGILRTIEAYAGLIVERGTPLPAGLAKLIGESAMLRGVMTEHAVPLRPCHCDTTGANLLDTGATVLLVDWEYAGMNDPAWDLAYLSVQSDFDPAQDARLATAYFSRPATAAERGRIEVHQALVELMSALWALVQASGGSDVADFAGYAERTVAACHARLRSTRFADDLAALRAGLTLRGSASLRSSGSVRIKPIKSDDEHVSGSRPPAGAAMSDLSSQDLLNAALEISAAAAHIPMLYFRSDIAVDDKADESPVTIADRETETHLRAAIEARFPSHGIFGEEFGRTRPDSPTQWIIDPIDGTKSFISGNPLFGILLAVMREGVAEAGVIRMPALNEFFGGAIGGEAIWNGRPIRCRTAPPLKEARVYINEAERMIGPEPERLMRLVNAGRFLRFANDCYAFGLLAAGHIDVVVDIDLKPYDYMPAVPVIEAAGGVVTDWQGRPLGLDSDGTLVAAGSARLHSEVVELLQ